MIERKLAEARARIKRYTPEQAASADVLIVDLRSNDERERDGIIPGSVHVPRSVLEWRCDQESDFANPFVREAKLDRQAMVRHYRSWLADQPELLRRLRAGELSGKALGCWCAPEPCHADVLLEYT